jgi:MFS family permease
MHVQKSLKNNAYIALLGAAHSLNHSLFLIAPPLLTLIMSDLGVSKAAIGLIATAASFLYGVGALAGGPLGDKIGEIKTITLCLIFSGISTFIMPLAGATGNIYLYAFSLNLIGAWASLYHPVANSLISKRFEGKVAETMGLHGVGGTLGTVLTPTIAWFLGVSFGWPFAFIVFGILCISLAVSFAERHMRPRLVAFFLCVLSFSLFCSGLAQCKLFTTVAFAWLFALFFLLLLWLQRDQHFTFAKFEGFKSMPEIVKVFKIRALWVLLIFNIAIGLFMKGVELFFPTYLKENRMIDPMWASIAYTLVLAAGVPGQWVGGKAADKFGSKRVLMVTSVGVCIGFFMLLLFPIGIVGMISFILFYGLSFYGHQPALNALTGFLSSKSQRGTVYGIFFFTSFGIGSLSQFIAGYVADVYNLEVAFYLLAAFALAALLLSFKLPEKREEK